MRLSLRATEGLYFALFFLVIAGCGGESDFKVSVSGDVTYDGKPIATGDIRFIPEAGPKAPGAGGTIKDGSYSLEGKQSLHQGSYRIEVKGFRNRDGSEGPVNLSDAEADYVQFVPSKFNTHSELQLTIDSSTPNDLRHDLALPK